MLSFCLSSTPNTSNIDQSAQISLAIGNTGSEALAAYLAQTINQNQKAIVEEQLAVINLVDNPDSDRLDFGATFQQRQHQNSFNGLAGGLIWKITAQTNSTSEAKNTPLSS